MIFGLCHMPGRTTLRSADRIAMLQPNETVGRFVIRGPLAQGASSEVYHATDTAQGGQEVALKILRSDRQRDVALRLRMLNEAQVLRFLSLPGVIRLLDTGEHRDGRLFLATELMPASLAQVPALAPPDALSVIAQLAETLAELHEQGIVHRDVKPQNILVGPDHRPKLTDFGIAKLPQAVTTSDSPFLPWSTESQTFVGTYGYAAPEQLTSSKDVDGRADVYALGVVLFELIAKRRPFVAAERGRLITQQLNHTAPLLSSVVPGLPTELVSLVARLLDRDPCRRPDAREAAGTLRALRLRPARRAPGWLRAVPVLAMLGLPAPRTEPGDLETLLEWHYRRFESALFTSTIQEAEQALRDAEQALQERGQAHGFPWARNQYKAAARDKERGRLGSAMQLYSLSQASLHTLVPERPAQVLKALSICADGLGELSYHLGAYDRALQHYDEAARTLPQTLAAAVSQRQVPSFLDYQRALVLREQGDLSAALRALAAAEEHQRTLLAQPDAAPADSWQLARVLSLRGSILAQGGTFIDAWLVAQEAERLAQSAVEREPLEKRFRLAHLASLLTLGEIAAARGQDAKRYDQQALAGLTALAASDRQSGHWAHALVEALVQTASRSDGALRLERSLAALEQIRQLKARGQWLEDIHIPAWQAQALHLSSLGP